MDKLHLPGPGKESIVPNDYDDESEVSGSSITSIVEEAASSPSIANSNSREKWSSKTSYILTLVGYAIGLGNVWRFPVLVQKFGATFFIPYVIAVVVLGVPVMYLELVIGQRLRKGPVGTWNEVSPYFGGIGITSGVICLLIGLYYNTLIAWSIAYFFLIFQMVLPWSNCDGKPPQCTQVGPSTYFWYEEILQITESIDEPGEWSWYVFLSLVITWGIVYLILVKGLKVSEKVVWFTAVFPYIVLIIFFIRGLFLEGMEYGYKLLIVFKWDQLLNYEIWVASISQVFYAIGTGCGVLISYASYLEPKNNSYNDVIMVSIISFFTSVLATFVVFSILGFRALKACRVKGLPIIDDNVFKEMETGDGPGLLFIVFAEAINEFPVPHIWAALLFLMIFTLGIDSVFSTIEGAIASIMDITPKFKRWIVTTIICGILTFCSTIFSFGWGSYVVVFLDTFSGNWPLLIICVLECVAIGWVYGLGRISYDIQLMSGKRPNALILISWKYCSAIIMIVLLIASIVKTFTSSDSLQYDVWNDTITIPKPWPTHTIAVGFIVTLSSVIWIPIVAIFKWAGRPFFKETPQMPFPEVSLRQGIHFDTDIEQRKTTKLERWLFGWSRKPYFNSEASLTKFPMSNRSDNLMNTRSVDIN